MVADEADAGEPVSGGSRQPIVMRVRERVRLCSFTKNDACPGMFMNRPVHEHVRLCSFTKNDVCPSVFMNRPVHEHVHEPFVYGQFW